MYSAMAKALVARDVAILFLKGAWAASFIIYMSLNVPLVNLTHIRAHRHPIAPTMHPLETGC